MKSNEIKILYISESIRGYLMALGFTSHFTHSNNHEFGSLILSNNDNETETSGSIAFYNHSNVLGDLLHSNCADSYEFSVSVSIDYSQYSSFISSANSTETAGSIACSSFSGVSSSDSGGSVSSFSGGGFSSCSSGGGGCSAASYTC